MLTLGIDLSSQPEKSAACLIDWHPRGADVLTIINPLTDDAVLALARNLRRSGNNQTDAIGIDAPFGWPQSFIEIVGRTPTGARILPPWNAALARAVFFRLTDRRVREELGIVPLSVAADKIAFPALRCTGLLDDLGVTDRSGSNGVFEVYPAAALKAWGLPFKGYKGKDPRNLKALRELFESVLTQCAWLRFLDESQRLWCMQSDDVLDALIASLVTRAAATGRTERPAAPHEVALAQVEGWIAIPTKDCLIYDLLLAAPSPKPSQSTA
jgi:hypothetical protein